ncbi:MAG: alcohol dehydrogenase catalytic domain-containing protein, partial [Candidatus Omnitrophota bacterium]
MRVANYFSNKDIRIEERPLPSIGAGELLIRVEASGICGTDVLEWYRRNKTPLVLGHEIAGIIEEVGAGLALGFAERRASARNVGAETEICLKAGVDLPQYKKGQRVAASHHVPCGECVYCLRGHQTVCDTLRKTHFDPGGFSEYLRMPAINVRLGGVYPLPDNVSYEEATFTEPLACVLRGQKIAQMASGKSVLVLGCGVAGLLHVLLAKARGASFVAVTDVVDYRLELARGLGADLAINAQREDVREKFFQYSRGKGADLVVAASGAEVAQKQALQLVEKAGTVLFFAAASEGSTIPLSIN